MGFILIKGNFMPSVGKPDGDSVRFLPKHPQLFDQLDGVKVKISGAAGAIKGTVQLRCEGMDAIEKNAIQPLAGQAKDNLLRLIGYRPDTNPTPEGHILTRMADPNGRPIAFLFAGKTARADGSKVYLDAQLLGKSVNFLQMQDGFAYPLYYNTLFADLRQQFNSALGKAQASKKGYWKTDSSLQGVTVKKSADLASIPPIWPKLFRRLEDYLKENSSMAGFLPWLEKDKERVLVIDRADETGLANVVKVQGNKVMLLEKPANLMVITKVKR